MDEVIAVIVVLCLWFGMMMLCIFVYRVSNKRHQELMLHAPLDPESVVHRTEAAVSQAGEGFNECTGCGFQNFKRSIFCQLCGETIDTPLRDPIESRKDKKSRGSSTLNSVSVSSPRGENLSVTNITRQQRARKRREWIRHVDASGHFKWKRDPTSKRKDGIHWPSCVLRFEPEIPVIAEEDTIDLKLLDNVSDTGDSDTNTSEDGELRSPIQMTVAERVAQITDECESMHVVLEDAREADAALFPVNVESSIDEGKLDGDATTFHGRYKCDFPTKLANFITTTSKIFVPPDVLHMKLHLDRDTVVQDSLQLMAMIQEKDVRVAFRIDFLNEKGLDAGGVYREWFLLLNEGLVKKETGIFVCVDRAEQTYYLNPNAKHDIGEDHLLFFLAAGRLLGRSLLEGNTTGFHLSLPLLKLILGQPLNFTDLEFFDPVTYKHLTWMLDNEGVDALCLDFTVSEQVSGKTVTVELIPGGSTIAVTEDNKHEYVNRLFRYRLVDSVAPQLYAFLRGLYEVIPCEILLMFDAEELDLVLCGADEIDVDDWERNTKYTTDLYKHPSLKWFWEIVREMSNEYRRRLLQFATGSSRVPFAGFSALTSYDGRVCPFTLTGIALSDEGYIRSHACFNRLDLPRHTNKQQLKTVLYAILNTEQHGFTTS